MQKISGAEIAKKIIDNLKSQPIPQKILAAILVGSTSSPQAGSSLSFLKQKEKVAKELGVDFRIYRFPEEIKNDDLRKEIGKIALLKRVGGVIVQLPLPEHLNKHYILNVIPREKDVDVLGERALGAFYTGRNPVFPPAVGVVKEIIGIMNYELGTRKAVIIGCGFLVGKPISAWLQDKVSELTIFNEKTKDLQNKLKDVDLIVSGVGKTNLFSSKDVKDGALIIDFGYDVKNEEINGDFNPIIHNPKFIIHYTPTPGGAGPILIAKLFENFYKLNAD